DGEVYTVEQKSARPLALRLRLRARRDRVASVTVNGAPVRWHVIENSVAVPRIDVLSPAAARHEVAIRWAGEPPRQAAPQESRTPFVPVRQGEMRWLAATEPQ